MIQRQHEGGGGEGAAPLVVGPEGEEGGEKRAPLPLGHADGEEEEDLNAVGWTCLFGVWCMGVLS